MDNRPPKRPHPFSILGLLSSISPPPPKRPFAPQDQSQTGYGSSSAEKSPKDFIKKLGDPVVEQNAKFKFGKIKSRFVITDLPDDPEALLAGIFEHCVNNAIESCLQSMGEKPDHLGCTISSPLLDPVIYTPIRPINENTSDTILNLFTKVAQSKKQDGITLWVGLFSNCIRP